MTARSGNIVAFFSSTDPDKIVIQELDGSAKYTVSRNEEGTNALGNEAGKTYGEALADGSLRIVNDDVDGPSCGMHGSIYIETEGRK